MKILSMDIENFLGIGRASVSLDRGGLTLVEGINNDSTTARSNGAGKSTMFDALYWGLYGLTRHGSKADEVVNRFTTGGCKVAITAEIGGKSCLVARHRKYGKTGDNSLKIEVDGDDITAGITRDSQALLESMLGMNALTFSKAVFFGQGDMKPFAALTDGELKTVFEQALGLTWFSDSRAKVGGTLSALKQQAAQAETNMLLFIGNRNLAMSRVDAMNESIAKDEEAEKTWRQSLEKNQATAMTLEDGLRVEIATLTEERNSLAVASGASGAKLDELNALHAKLSDAIAAENTTLARSDTMVNSLRRRIEELVDRQTALAGMVGATCPTCTQVIEAENIERTKQVLTEDGKKVQEDMGQHKEVFVAAQGKRSKFNTLLNQLADKIRTVEGEANVANTRIAGIGGELLALGGQLTAAANTIEGIKTDIAAGNSKTAQIAASKKTLDMLLSDLDVANDRITQLKEGANDLAIRQEKVQLLSDALGNAGVKSYVFDSITPELNSYSNRYLQILEPDLSVEISTVTKLKTGDYREKFSIDVSNVNGANSLSGSSGGERQKFNLAIALAFNKLMRSMAGSDVPLMVLDEPFEALDSGSSDQVFELLKDLDADNLYLITHNESVRDLIPDRMIVEKTGGVATIRSAD